MYKCIYLYHQKKKKKHLNKMKYKIQLQLSSLAQVENLLCVGNVDCV